MFSLTFLIIFKRVNLVCFMKGLIELVVSIRKAISRMNLFNSSKLFYYLAYALILLMFLAIISSSGVFSSTSQVGYFSLLKMLGQFLIFLVLETLGGLTDILTTSFKNLFSGISIYPRKGAFTGAGIQPITIQCSFLSSNLLGSLFFFRTTYWTTILLAGILNCLGFLSLLWMSNTSFSNLIYSISPVTVTNFPSPIAETILLSFVAIQFYPSNFFIANLAAANTTF